MTYRRWFSLILVLLLAVATVLVVIVAFAFHVIAQPGFADRVGNPIVVIQERPFRMRNQSCEVLAYGDSAADTGIDPKLITAETGMTACNISATGPVVNSVDMLPVDGFLRNNPPPRFIVLSLAPENFYRQSAKRFAGGYFPFVMLIRNAPVKTSVGALLTHPGEAVQFAVYFLTKELYVPPATLEHNRSVERRVLKQFDEMGYLTIPDETLTNCNYRRPDLTGTPDSRWVERLREKYGKQGIRLIVKTSPLPECDPDLAQFRSQLTKPMLDAPIQTLPIDMFLKGGRHVNNSGARIQTQQLISLLK